MSIKRKASMRFEETKQKRSISAFNPIQWVTKIQYVFQQAIASSNKDSQVLFSVAMPSLPNLWMIRSDLHWNWKQTRLVGPCIVQY